MQGPTVGKRASELSLGAASKSGKSHVGRVWGGTAGRTLAAPTTAPRAASQAAVLASSSLVREACLRIVRCWSCVHWSTGFRASRKEALEGSLNIVDYSRLRALVAARTHCDVGPGFRRCYVFPIRTQMDIKSSLLEQINED